MAVFTVNYKPGELKAVAFDENGNKKYEEKLITAGKPYAIRLTADRTKIAANPQSLVYVLAEIVDKNGNVVNDAAMPINFSVEGNAKIIATGSGNPKDPKGYFHTDRITDEGKALAIVKSDGTSGKIKLKVSGRALKSTSLTLSAL